MEIFWRMHWFDCPEFSADNASTAGWGAPSSEREEGYSCCWSLDDLRRYFYNRMVPNDQDGVVIAFDGNLVGKGPDLEPLAIPTKILRIIKPSDAFRHL